MTGTAQRLAHERRLIAVADKSRARRAQADQIIKDLENDSAADNTLETDLAATLLSPYSQKKPTAVGPATATNAVLIRRLATGVIGIVAGRLKESIGLAFLCSCRYRTYGRRRRNQRLGALHRWGAYSRRY